MPRSTRVVRHDPLAVFEPATRDWFRAAFEEPTEAQVTGLAGHRGRGAHAHLRTHGQRQDAGGLPVVPGPAARGGRAPVTRCRPCGCSTSRRSRRSCTMSIATCGHHWRASPWRRSGSASRRRRSGWACARAIPRPRSGVPSASILRTSSSPRRSRCTCILTSQARAALGGVRWVIVDEIHALAGTKRGAHLALSLERLEVGAAQPPQRIGLSATQRPLLGGGRLPRRSTARPGWRCR